jgi:polar amino acid transport system substrate-binding protein
MPSGTACSSKQWLLQLLLCMAPIAAARPVLLAIDELPPWTTLEEGRVGGIYADIVRELGRRLGVEIEAVRCPPKRCLYMLEQGKADLGIGFKSTPARRRYLHFLATPYRSKVADKVFYVLQEQGVEVRSYADLASLRIGIKLGVEYFEQFDRDQSLSKAAVQNTEANFRKLALGRIDTVIVPEDQGDAMVDKLGLRHRIGKAAFRLPDSTTRAVSVALQSPLSARIDELELAMADMARDGTLDALYRRNHVSLTWRRATAGLP